MVSTAPAAVLPSVEQLSSLHVLTSRVHSPARSCVKVGRPPPPPKNPATSEAGLYSSSCCMYGYVQVHPEELLRYEGFRLQRGLP